MMHLAPYRRRSAQLCDYLPWAALIGPGVVLNKDGAFQRTLAFRGADLDASTEAELMGAALRLNNALRRFGSGWCLHIEARRAPTQAYPQSDWAHKLAWLVDEERRAHFAAADACFESRYFLTFTWLPPAEQQGRLEQLLFEGGQDHKGASVDYSAHLAHFVHETDQVAALLEASLPLARWLNDAETLSYLHACVSDRAHAVAVPSTPFHLDALLADTPLVGGLAPRLGAQALRIISFRSFVSMSEPGLMDGLNRLPLACRWVTRFLPLDREAARREIETIRKRWFSKRKGLLTLLREALFREEALLVDNDAANQAADADLALQDMGAEAVGAGFVTITLIIAEPSEAAADEAVRLVRQLTDGLGFITQVESVNAVEAWLGSLPGQAYADVRRPILLTPSLAHLLPLSAVWAGPERNAHLEAPVLMRVATDGATPFRLDLHVGDVGHTMIVGPTGAGKSVLLAALALQWLRFGAGVEEGAQIYLFDKGRSSRATILGLGGDFFDLGEEDALALQPLRDIDHDDERAWALDWLSDLLRAAGLHVDADLRAGLWASLEVLASRAPEERTLTLLAALVQSAPVRAALGPYTQAGAHGRLLDAEHSSLGYGAIQAFEMDDLMRRPAAARAVLGVLFRALDRRFDGRPSLLLLDEAWLFLKDSVFAAQIQDWLKTLRKRNVAVVFASQELADIEASGIASTIIEACATRIFLANDRAREPRSRAFYQALGLNQRQIELIAGAAPKRDYLFVNRHGCRRFELAMGPATLAFVAAARPEDQAEIDRVYWASGADGFAAAWLDARGLKSAADAIRRFEAAQSQSDPAAAEIDYAAMEIKT